MTTRRIDSDLLARLVKVRDRAYAPYSGFRVGAAVTTPAGRSHFGCNVETVHYKSVCAEAAALSAMIAAGERRVERVHVVSSGARPCPPCGDCRQRLLEFAEADAEVLLVDDNGAIRRRLSLAQLLPEAFGADTAGDD